MIHKQTRSLWSLIKTQARLYALGTAAALAPMFALTAPAVVASVGGAVDVAQIYLIKQRLTHALDAAALAAAASETDQVGIEAKVKEFIKLNYPEDKIGDVYDIEVNVTGDVVTASAKASFDTNFIKLVGVTEIEVDVNTEVTREVRGIEVALVLDVTGSMQGTNIAALRNASRKFVETIFDRVSDPKYLRVGMVPYAATVNLQGKAEEVVGGSSSVNVPGRPDVTYDLSDNKMWQGCVMERPYPYDMNDANYFDGGYWEPFWWEHTDDTDDNHWDSDIASTASLNMPYTECNNRRTPNLGCPLTNPIMPLTSNEQSLLTASDNLVYWCRGGTFANIGMSWGWRVLSPTEPFTEGASYNNLYWSKVVVMMTDGDNQFWKKPGIDDNSDYTGYGRIGDNKLGTTNRNTAKTVINDRFAETCELMKDEGITIYTITFRSNINNTTREVYEDCASDPTKYRHAPGNEDLVKVFEDISKEISNLHISQ